MFSLVSRDSCNYSSSLSLGQRSCADSGYYSNRDTYMSQDYEQMTGSNPIAIPGTNPQGRAMIGTFVPNHYTRRPSGASLQFDPYHGQRNRVDSFGSDFSSGSELRPALPAKLKMVGNHGNIKPTVSISFHGNRAENPYENISEIPGANYEDMQRLSNVTRQVPEGPLMSSSPESVYMNPQRVNSPDSLNFINMNYPIIYDRPPIDNRYNCHGRCYSFPELDMKRKSMNGEEKRNSFSSEKKIALHSLNESKSAPILDREVETTPNSKNWETGTADEAMSEEIYENIEIYNVPQALISDTPPPLPVKRKNSKISVHRNSGSHDLDISKKLALSQEMFEEHYSRPVSQDVPPNFDSHLYAEISDKLIKELNLEDQSGLTDTSSFMEISKDYADLDAICAKLRGKTAADAELAENANEAQDLLCPVESNTSKNNDVLWRRFSDDQHRIQQHTRRIRRSVSSDDNSPNSRSEGRRSSDASTRSLSSNSLKHPCSELEGVQSLHSRATLVTTV